MSTAKSHVRKPDVFTGDRKKLETFIRDCEIYIAANENDFANDATKTQFILSHVVGGEAETWKENYFNTIIAKNPARPNWETPNALIRNLRTNFSREDDVEESLRKLETLKQGSKTAEEIVNKHRVLMARAKLSDSTLAVRMFRRSLNPSLAMKILTDPDKSNTLEDIVTIIPATAAVAATQNTPATPGTPATTVISKYGWYSKAIQYDQIYREARAAQNEDRGGSFYKSRELRTSVQKGRERSWRNPNTTPAHYKDLNAMDVDAMELNVNAMSEAKKAYLMKKGACFKCEVAGHLARDHDEYIKNLKKPSSGFTKGSSGSSAAKPNAKEIAKFIRAMNQEEQDALFEEVEKDDSLSDKAKDF
jgi:hypothetical protein